MNQDKLYCKNCGSELEHDSNFCTKCGSKVEQIASGSLYSQINGIGQGNINNTETNNNMYGGFLNDMHNSNDNQNSMPMNNNVNNEYNHANMNSNNDMQNNSYPNNNVETNNNAPTYQVKQEFNWTTIGGIACGIISLFIFWWLSLAGISIEIKALKDINDNNQKGKIVAYIGLFVCSASAALYYLGPYIFPTR